MDQSTHYIREFETGKAGPKQFAELLRQNRETFTATAKTLKSATLEQAAGASISRMTTSRACRRVTAISAGAAGVREVAPLDVPQHDVLKRAECQQPE